MKVKKLISFWERHVALLVVAFGALGYGLSWGFSDSLLLAPSDAPVFLWMDLIKTIFFSSLKMLVAPIVFFSLLDGLLQMHALTHLGDLGRATLTYYFTTTMIAILIGLTVVVFIHPWESDSGNGLQKERLKAEHSLSSDRFIERKEGTPIGVATKMAKEVLANPFEAFVKNN
ncbi:MAG: cation:dicarboxylase symporter family transporter, partial [Bdellovibrionales bacterium]|nr:cation:dicarboxylase symporter family transporter [Bdellovibrionales bacterium]